MGEWNIAIYNQTTKHCQFAFANETRIAETLVT